MFTTIIMLGNRQSFFCLHPPFTSNLGVTAKYVRGDFPRERYHGPSDNSLSFTLSAYELSNTHISTDDLLKFKEYFLPDTSLNDVQVS